MIARILRKHIQIEMPWFTPKLVIRYDYDLLSHQIDRTAGGFLNQGIQPGDRVALWSSNVPEWIFSMMGLAKIGAMTVPIDPAATKDTLHYILEQSESCGLIIAGENDDKDVVKTAIAAKKTIPSLEHIFVMSGSSEADAIPGVI